METLGTSPDALCKHLQERTARRGVESPALSAQSVRELHRQNVKHLTAVSALSRPTSSLFACPCGNCGLVTDGNMKAYAQLIPGEDRSRSLPLATGERGKDHFFHTDEAIDGVVRVCKQARSKPGQSTAEEATEGATRAVCGNCTLKAASKDDSKGKAWLKIEGLYVISCWHSIVLKGMPFKGGELAIYPFVLYLLAGVKAAVLCGDTMCRCKQCRDALATIQDLDLPAGQPDVKTMDLGALTLCVNAMHVWGVRSLQPLLSSTPWHRSARARDGDSPPPSTASAHRAPRPQPAPIILCVCVHLGQHCPTCRIAHSIRHADGVGLNHGECLEQVGAAPHGLPRLADSTALASAVSSPSSTPHAA